MTSTSETPPGTNGFALPPRVAQQKYRVAQSNVPNDRATRDHLKGYLYVEAWKEAHVKAATMGIRNRLNTLAQGDAAIVASAREAGAIVLGKSNVPLLLFALRACHTLLLAQARPLLDTHLRRNDTQYGAVLAQDFVAIADEFRPQPRI